jgi:hypothetical protein
MAAPAEEAAQARGAISSGNDGGISRLQILLTWVFAGKYYRTRFPARPAARTIAKASRKIRPSGTMYQGAVAMRAGIKIALNGRSKLAARTAALVALHKIAGDRYAVAGDEEYLPKLT